ncbi:hypothetical protein V6N13_005076 [Hibiscus sabdariffa]
MLMLEASDRRLFVLRIVFEFHCLLRKQQIRTVQIIKEVPAAMPEKKMNTKISAAYIDHKVIFTDWKPPELTMFYIKLRLPPTKKKTRAVPLHLPEMYLAGLQSEDAV